MFECVCVCVCVCVRECVRASMLACMRMLWLCGECVLVSILYVCIICVLGCGHACARVSSIALKLEEGESRLQKQANKRSNKQTSENKQAQTNKQANKQIKSTAEN